MDNLKTENIDNVSKQKNDAALKAICEKIVECAESSTLHAIPNIFRSNHWTVKVFMTVCLIVSTGVCVWFLVQVYTNYEVITTIRSGYVTSIAFPIISFCNSNKSNPNITHFFKDCYFIGEKCGYEQDFSRVVTIEV